MSMDTKSPRVPTGRNPRTEARFRRESWWQITFPMIVVTLLMLGCIAGLLTLSGAQGVSIVADYSMILLILPMLVLGLVILGLAIGLIYLVNQGIDKLPPYAYVTQKAVFSVQRRVEGIAKAITGAIISIQSFVEGILRFIQERLQPSGGNGSEPPTPPPDDGAKRARKARRP